MRSHLASVLTAGLAVQYAVGTSSLWAPDARHEFSCATFSRDLGEAGLIARYGRENVRSAPVVGSDDGPQDGTVVFPDQDGLRIEIVWWDPESRERLAWVRTRGGDHRWEAPNGITVGMDLKTIERRNGWPFRLRGFSGEGDPGRILSWGNGRFKSATAAGCTVHIFLLPADNTVVDPLLGRQLGRGEFSSGHPAMQTLNPRVYQMVVARDWR